MLVFRVPLLSRVAMACIEENLRRQAETGVVVIPPGIELLNEVPADEEIKVVQQIPEGVDVVKVPAHEWQDTMEYIQALHDCATCKHAPKCPDPACFFAECTVAGCACRDCLNGSGWEWRFAK